MHGLKRYLVPAVLLIGALAGCGGQTTTLGDAIPAVGGAPEPKPIITPKVGECRMLESREMIPDDTPPATDCSEQHNMLTYAAADVTAEPPFDDDIQETCEDGFAEALGLTKQQLRLTIFSYNWYQPSPRAYALGSRSYRCDIVANNTSDGQPVPLPSGGLPLLEGEEVPDAYSLCRTSKAKNVSCTTPHAWRATGTFEGTGKEYPSDATVKKWADDKCNDQVTTETYLYSWPGPESWAEGGKTIFCWSTDQRS